MVQERQFLDNDGGGSPDESTLAFRNAADHDRDLKRTEQPDDLVGAVAFFASPDSDFITGQIFVVDGGKSIP